MIPPPAQRSGNVGEYTPAEAVKLPPPPAGSKYATLNNGSVVWDGYLNDGHGGPMPMPDGVSLEDNVKIGRALAGFADGNPSGEPVAIPPREAAMVFLFLPGYGSMDYQSAYGSGGQYDRSYVDFTNYNYGVVAAAAGYSQDEALANAGMVNEGKDWYDRRFHGAPPKDMSGPHKNKVRNAEMIVKGYDDYTSGKVARSAK
jgi:hypothetical protein